MSFSTTPVLLVLGGMLCLLAAFTGALLWTDGKPRALITHWALRVAIGTVGVVLVGLALWQESVLKQQAPDLKVEEQIKALKAQLSDATAKLSLIENELQLTQGLASQVVDDYRSSGLRTGLSVTGTEGEYCARNAAALKPVEWSAGVSTPCANVVNSYWPVQVVVPIKNGHDRLLSRLQSLRVPIAMADSNAGHSGITAQGLGIVLPTGTPLSLVCAIREAFVTETTAELVAVAETREFRQLTKFPLPTSSILVGVEFGKQFPDRYSKYREFSKEDWRKVCTESEDQFYQTTSERLKALRPTQASSPK